MQVIDGVFESVRGRPNRIIEKSIRHAEAKAFRFGDLNCEKWFTGEH